MSSKFKTDFIEKNSQVMQVIFKKDGASFIQNQDSGVKKMMSYLEPAESEMISWLQMKVLKSNLSSPATQERYKAILTERIDEEILSAERAILVILQLLATRPALGSVPDTGGEIR